MKLCSTEEMTVASAGEKRRMPYDIDELAAKHRKLAEEATDIRRKANTERLISEVERLVDRAKKLEGLDDEATTSSIALLHKGIEHAETRILHRKYIPSLRQKFSKINFDACTEVHLCDLVWAYQSLSVQNEGPTITTVLSCVRKAIREARDEQLEKRWSTAMLDKLETQVVSATSHHDSECLLISCAFLSRLLHPSRGKSVSMT